MLIILDSVLLALLVLALGYLTMLSILALTVKRRKDFSTNRLRTFAVVVPAHNEESTIGSTLENILSVDYPEQCFDVVVVADNCTDLTAVIARGHRALVLERESADAKGKGYALRWCFDRLLSPIYSYDALVVVDADSRISPNFLNVMNWYLEKGALAVQASDLVQEQRGAWSPEVTRLGLTLYNYVRPSGRKVLKCSAGLRGNGMCFSAELLRQVPWNAFSLTEDLQYGLELLLHGVPVHFAPETAVYATMPSESKHAVTQRARWESGRSPIVRAYAMRLLKAAYRQKSFKHIDALTDLIMPPLVNTVVAVAALTAVHLTGAIAGVEDADVFFYLWLACWCLGVLHVVIGLIAAGADLSLLKALLYVPRYAVWKAGVYARLIIRGKPDDWVRTTREHTRKATPQ